MPKTKRTPTKDKTGIKSTPVVTPVAAYRQLADKGPVQSTLTQLFRMEHNDESPSENESSVDSAFEPKKKRSVQKEVNTPPPKQVSTTKTKRFSSKDAAYNGDKTKAQPGDIIMSTVEKIQHPLFEQGIVKKDFVLFGIVRSFSYHDRDKGDTTGYARDHERLEVCWCNLIKGDHRYIDKRTVPPPVTIDSHLYINKRMYPRAVKKDDVTLLAKRNDPDLSGLNPFIATEVERVYYFASPGGWSTKV